MTGLTPPDLFEYKTPEEDAATNSFVFAATVAILPKSASDDEKMSPKQTTSEITERWFKPLSCAVALWPGERAIIFFLQV